MYIKDEVILDNIDEELTSEQLIAKTLFKVS
jgi:hypothetical protein